MSKILVVASAQCVWKDLETIGFTPQPTDSPPFDIMCVNDMIMHFPAKIKHGYSNDWHMLQKWKSARRPRYAKEWRETIQLHTCRMGVHSNIQSHKLLGTGTSSLNALLCAIELGYTDIIGVGMPQDSTPHYFDPPWVGTNFDRESKTMEDGQIKYWSNAFRKLFGGKVRLVSGRPYEWAVKNGYQDPYRKDR